MTLMIKRRRSSGSIHLPAAALVLAFMLACPLRRVGEDPTPLSDGDAQQATRVIYAFWRTNRTRDSAAIRSLSTSDQPLRYAQAFWGMEGAFPDSTNIKVLYACRVSGIRDTVFVEVDLQHMQCPLQSGGGSVHWRFEILPRESWRIAALGGDPC